MSTQRKLKSVPARRITQAALPASSRPLVQLFRRNPNGFVDDLEEAAGYIPDARVQAGLKMFQKARQTGLGKRIESGITGLFGGGARVRREEKAIERAVEAKEAKAPIMMGTSKQRVLTRFPKMSGRRDAPTASGCEPLGPLVAPTGGWAQGQVMYQTMINPTTMGCPKLARTAKGYEFYHLTGSFKITGGAGTNVAGSYIAYVDMDPSDEPDVSANVNVKAALNHLGAVPATVHDEMTCRIPAKMEMQRLYVDNDDGSERFTSVGRLVLVCDVPIAAGVQIGTLYFDWRVKLSGPQEDSAVPTGNYWRCDYTSPTTTAAMGSGTYPRLTSGTLASVDSKSTLAIAQTTTDRTAGWFHLPAGNYWISAFLYGGTAVDLGGWNLLDAALPAQLDPSKGYQCQHPTDYAVTSCQWVTSPGEFILSISSSYTGTWAHARIMICAVDASPYAATWKLSCQLLARARSALAQQSQYEAILASVRSHGSAVAESKDEKAATRLATVPAAASSTSSAESSSAGVVCGSHPDERWVRLPESARRLNSAGIGY